MPQEEPPQDKKPEIYLPPVPVEELPSYLGFKETPELTAARQELIQAAKGGDWPLISRLRSAYQKLGEALVESLPSDDFDRGKIGMTVSLGLAMRDAGRAENYGADLQNAHQHAWNARYDYVVGILEFEMAAIGEEVGVREPRDPRPPRTQPPSDAYLVYLTELGRKFEAEAPPAAEVSLEQNHLLVNGKTLEADDGPAILWRALTAGRDTISQGLEEYREQMRQQDPDKTIENNTPLRLVRLADHPRDVFTPKAYEDIGYVHEYYDSEVLKDELQPLWQAVQAAGLQPKLWLFASREGWASVYLWSNSSYSYLIIDAASEV